MILTANGTFTSSRKSTYLLHLSHALLTRVLSISFLCRFVGRSPRISEVWFGEEISMDSRVSAIVDRS
jgi:hypothetical protein